MIDDIKIEKMNETHLEDIAFLEKKCFSVPWSEKMLEAELEKENARFYVAITKNEVSGYIGANNVLGEVYVNNIAVFYNYRRFGIGEALLSHLISVACEENCSMVTLEVRVSNDAARGLYEKLGFENVGMRKNFYDKPNEDAIIYTKYLGET
ncbi:MAG: ribosomal protein S18-alanine N-acetyltransferase [Clostridia bacterium]|nr:ribosomal protein S18-alanine N-acetyltransferase [Clostridia bacterium]